MPGRHHRARTAMKAGAIGLYEEALSLPGAGLLLRTACGRALPLQLERWCGPADRTDQELLLRCQGPVLDIGCGPGRLTIALAERGIPVLGIGGCRVRPGPGWGRGPARRSAAERGGRAGAAAPVRRARGQLGAAGGSSRAAEGAARRRPDRGAGRGAAGPRGRGGAAADAAPLRAGGAGLRPRFPPGHGASG